MVSSSRAGPGAARLARRRNPRSSRVIGGPAVSFGKVVTNWTGRTATGSDTRDEGPAQSGAVGRSLTSDLVLVHKVFRRELRLLPLLIADVAAGDCGRAVALTAHCRELTTALLHHHEAESELLWPRLRHRTPIDGDVAARLQDGHRTHAALVAEMDGLLPLWEQGADPDLAAVLADILTELADAVADHLDAAAEFVFPALDEHFTAAEWLALGLRAASWIPLHRMAWLLGAMLEDATPVERANLMARVPGPARLLYRMVGQEQYTREMRALRGSFVVAQGSGRG